MPIDPVFAPAALADFKALYPERPGRIDHGLAGHPAFALDALVDLATRLDPAQVEYNRGDLPVGVDPKADVANGLDIAATIRSIEDNGSWMVLKFVERDPVYKAILEETLHELRPVVDPTTGPMLKMEGFIFVSSPGSMTPFHFDPEHNILLQLRGTKTMTVFPADDPTIAAPLQHETFHMGGHRNLPWQDAFLAKGVAVNLEPGQAVHVPVKAPHFVRNGPSTSISFSITWRSEWSYREASAHGLNAILRRTGIDPAMPARFPAQNHAKSLAYRAIGKARTILGKD
ncbi:transcriptional regulator [Sphingomonas arantia]|uniref:Transcriptional regulator n=1 Tax=Sphingomonas arantia TaxID=1460676 RepID=A0ABW4TT91_9SPHN